MPTAPKIERPLLFIVRFCFQLDQILHVARGLGVFVFAVLCSPIVLPLVACIVLA